MKPQAPHGNATSGAERRFQRLIAADEANAAQRKSVVAAKRHTKAAQCLQASGQDAFAAGFVDGGARGVGDGDIEPLQPRRDGRGQTGRSAADYQYIGLQSVYRTHTPSSAKISLWGRVSDSRLPYELSTTCRI